MTPQDPDNKGEVVLYQPDDALRIEVLIENETAWMAQRTIAELFDVKVPAITKHLKNIFDEGELCRGSTVSKKEIVQTEGGLLRQNQGGAVSA
jgi:hypothetical protein